VATKALDLITMGHALSELSNTYLGDSPWQGINPNQETFLAWYAAHRAEIDKLGGLEALAATNYEVLNSFLQARGFEPLFQPFIGVGVASVLDMLVEWVTKGTQTSITRYNPSDYSREVFPGFLLEDGVETFSVAGHQHPLVRLHTKTGHSLWLTTAQEPESGLELATFAQHTLVSQRRPDYNWDGVKVPMLEINVQPDLGWMIGAHTVSTDGEYHEISQAFQMFRLRANEVGARVRVATGFATRGVSIGPVPYVFSEPFIGFFTQPGNDKLAIAAFFADTDSWQNPGGTLEELV
jgi:hypothetical protein